MRRPIFLDRDGVMNVDVTPYVANLSQLRIFPFTEEALRLLHEAGFEMFVVSNQQGVSKGITPPEELEKITEALQDVCRKHGFEIRKFFYCTAHKNEDHTWRKPQPGMIFAARDEFGLDLDGAFLIGDKWSDIEAGRLAGLRPLLVYSGVTPPGEEATWTHQPERAFENLLEAVRWVVSQEG